MRRLVTVTTLALVSLAGCGDDNDDERANRTTEAPAAQSQPSLTVDLRGAEPTVSGTVELTEQGGAVQIAVDVRGLEPGFHGFHVHQKGICDPDARDEGEPAPFSSAAGHFQGDGGRDHGEHAGDLPTLYAGEDGRARLTVTTDRFTLGDLRDADGSAVMVHAMRDNQANVPDRYESGGDAGPDAKTLDTGDAGDRVACGAIER